MLTTPHGPSLLVHCYIFFVWPATSGSTEIQVLLSGDVGGNIKLSVESSDKTVLCDFAQRLVYHPSVCPLFHYHSSNLAVKVFL